MPRLPQPGGDDGVWGTVLNDFLATAHNSDGSIKSGAVSKGDVGLSNVDNTSDANKPVSSAAQTAFISWVDVVDANTVRPSGAARVFWIGGTTEPLNMQTGDIWFKSGT